jgi:hypothetical protein
LTFANQTINGTNYQRNTEDDHWTSRNNFNYSDNSVNQHRTVDAVVATPVPGASADGTGLHSKELYVVSRRVHGVLNYEKFSVNCHFFSHQCRDTG